MTLGEKQRSLAERYLLIEDLQERLAVITARGRRWPAPPEDALVDENRVAGCVSRVWLTVELRDHRCHFRMQADSPLVQGLAALICELCDGAEPSELAGFEPAILNLLGLDRTLSPTRLNGLQNLWETIRRRAITAS
jgi:cysteine desulfuration protein SufE